MKQYYPSDYHKIQQWCKSQGVMAPGEGDLSSTGFINNHAVCFIYLTNSSVAYLETLIADNISDKHTKSICIDEVIEACLKLAKELGYKTVLSNTKIQQVIDRSDRFGFKPLIGYSTLINRL
jgi:hypothetical protein